MKKFSILVIENDADEQVFIREAFEKTEYFQLLDVLDKAQDLFPWLYAHRTYPPDAILSELLMPLMDGYDVINNVCSDDDFSTIPVYIMSTAALDAIVEKCSSLGAAGFLEKPNLLQDYSVFLKRLHTMMTDKISNS